MNVAFDRGLRGKDVAAVEAKADETAPKRDLASRAAATPAIRTERRRAKIERTRTTMPKVRFEPDGIEIEVPIGTSILEASKKAHAQVGSACGGVCACSTCHVYVKEGLGALTEASDREEDIMDKAFDVKSNSRLGCQSKILRDVTVVVEISRESRQAFLDEHPEIRAALKQAQDAAR